MISVVTCVFITYQSLPFTFTCTQYSPLLLAARKGHAKCVEILMGKKANITVTSDQGYNCLMEAIQGGHK